MYRVMQIESEVRASTPQVGYNPQLTFSIVTAGRISRLPELASVSQFRQWNGLGCHINAVDDLEFHFATCRAKSDLGHDFHFVPT